MLYGIGRRIRAAFAQKISAQKNSSMNIPYTSGTLPTSPENINQPLPLSQELSLYFPRILTDLQSDQIVEESKLGKIWRSGILVIIRVVTQLSQKQIHVRYQHGQAIGQLSIIITVTRARGFHFCNDPAPLYSYFKPIWFPKQKHKREGPGRRRPSGSAVILSLQIRLGFIMK